MQPTLALIHVRLTRRAPPEARRELGETPLLVGDDVERLARVLRHRARRADTATPSPRTTAAHVQVIAIASADGKKYFSAIHRWIIRNG